MRKKDGKGMAEDIQDRYGFKIGILVMIQTKILEFKLQRPYSSFSHSSYTSIN